MLVIFPIGTDAPVYHWPFATCGIILLNILVLILQIFFPHASDLFLLHYGSFNPLSWFTSICMHQGVGHLVGNIIGIGLFGLIIEGKVGWWRFLLIYFGIGVSSCAVEQTIMLFGSSGASLGASGVVFGLLAMAMVWAPENEVTLNYVCVVLFRPYTGSFEVSMSTLAFFMIAIEFLIAAFTGFPMSSAVLHLLGATPGFAIAYFMIRMRLVDCEGYDLISIWKGKRGERVPTVEAEKLAQKRKLETQQEAQHELKTGLKMVNQYIDAGHYEMALNRFKMLSRLHHSLVMTEKQYLTIIDAFYSNELKQEQAVALISDYLVHYDSFKIPLTLRRARFHIVRQALPRKGLASIKSLEWREMTPKQSEYAHKLVARAQRMIADGAIEIDG